MFHGKSIADVLNLSVAAALELFANVPRIRRILKTLDDVGLGYISLGQAAPTLSGGEAQRVKLAAELARPDTGKTLYILDEPTTGLHFDDVRKLLDVIHRLADLGNTVVVIEHNLEVIKTADWVIDLGPEAGRPGGDLVAEGTPEEIVKNPAEPHGKVSRDRCSQRAREEAWVTFRSKPPPEKARGTRRLLGAEARASRFSSGNNGRQRRDQGERKPAIRATGVRGNGKPSVHGSRRGESSLGDRRAQVAHAATAPRRNGRPVRWDGRILERTVDRIEELGQSETGLAPTEWSQRGVVRINSVDKTKIAFPFFHATTSSEWVVILRFFVPKNTFVLGDLEARLKLVPFHQSETPVLCDQPRLKFTNLGPFHEITIVGHSGSRI